MNPQAQAVFDFWFTPAAGQDPEQPRREWFQKNDAFDREIAQRFGTEIEQALAGGLRDWDTQGPRAALARILLLDQFCRNVYRGTPQAFAGDTEALPAALNMIATGADQALAPLQRVFVYMPLEHAEDMTMQEQCVRLFTRLAAERPDNKGIAGNLDYAHRHYEVIRRFGRFPHRNAILGRVSTPEEVVFLKQPGSGF
ncbi:DUF924 family protein [Duganella callida]|uniref:DUF924 domain-containing protein n=1 Tax=Duganella callida TaxID=2561932 RepID=A0A4Y9SKQ3_9BURK|nr:DUF924 family protein [Duganella callida]TFW27265.1 DUF924 domain-containing protein [Duganella callida]